MKRRRVQRRHHDDEGLIDAKTDVIAGLHDALSELRELDTLLRRQQRDTRLAKLGFSISALALGINFSQYQHPTVVSAFDCVVFVGAGTAFAIWTVIGKSAT